MSPGGYALIDRTGFPGSVPRPSTLPSASSSSPQPTYSPPSNNINPLVPTVLLHPPTLLPARLITH